MSDRMEAPPRPSRAPVPRSQMPRMQPPGAPRRNRRRWALAAAVTVCWVVLWTVTGSLVGGTLVLLFLAGLGVVTVLALRALGVTRDHPWVRQIATRPWRDGQEVLQLALRHLPEVFVVTPSGALLAPTAVELRLNPRDFGSLGERMDIGLVETSAAEVYGEQVAAHGARLAGPGPVEVSLISDPSVPEGRYQLRQGRPLGAAGPAGRRPVPAWPVRVPAGSPRPRVPAGGQAPPRVPALRWVPTRRGAAWMPTRRGAAWMPIRPGAAWARGPAGPSPVTAGPRRRRRGPPTRPLRSPRPRRPSRGRPGYRGRAGPQHDPDAPADHRGPGERDEDVGGPGRPRRGRAQPPRRAHGVPRARPVYLLRRPVVGRQPGHERDDAERHLGRRRAAAARRRRDPLGHKRAGARVPGADRVSVPADRD